MARICKACRLPVDGDPRDHDCPEDREPETGIGLTPPGETDPAA